MLALLLVLVGQPDLDCLQRNVDTPERCSSVAYPEAFQKAFIKACQQDGVPSRTIEYCACMVVAGQEYGLPAKQLVASMLDEKKRWKWNAFSANTRYVKSRSTCLDYEKNKRKAHK